MILRIIIAKILFVVTVMGANVSSAYDAELAESSKCSRYFTLYEQEYHVPSNLIRAIGITESGKLVKSNKQRMAWPWTVNAKGKGYYFKSKREAIRAVKKFQAKGIKSIDVGCMQIKLKYHPEAFENLEQAFEPKYNIGYAAKFLHTKYLKLRNWKSAVGSYHNGKPSRHRKYIKKVYSAWRIADKSIDVASNSYINLTDASKASKTDAGVSALTRNVLSKFE